jgi:hypothetical protein
VYVHGGHYAAWAAFLDRWGAGENLDPAALPVLGPEDFQADSWQRLADRITAAVDTRMRAWGDRLTREMAAAPDEFTAGRAMNHARWSLTPIRDLAGSPALPEFVRTALTEMVETAIRDNQQQLDDDVDRLRRDGLPAAAIEARRRTIRDNPLTAVLHRANDHVHADAWAAADPMGTPRRRVIVDPPLRGTP